MPQPSRRPLKPNPFISLRDPETGKWKVIINFNIEKIRSEKIRNQEKIGSKA